ncbi:cyclic peptide export ABC transporter [Nodosilinea nodulosa]|uniref:cyclic peptide export ABC transporter n=1 Tax=Nodosilinea nodulosa TaxID=416001 RepID=UPI0002DF2052|nr:cyclic peptide export ABC transporter [Nodosilinea nodulosa]
MDLLAFLLRSSWQSVAVALVTGFVSGGCSAGLIALISLTLATDAGSGPAGSMAGLAWAFGLLVAVALVTGIISRVVLVQFSQRAVFALQLRLSRQILATELSRLEQVGLPRLLAVLTEDIQTISAAVSTLPLLCVNLAVVAGCMVYISWLSWQVLGLVLALALVASLSCGLLLRAGRRFLAVARDRQDRLFQHFRTLVQGIKELKLHSDRQQDFLSADLETTARQFRHYSSRGLSLFAVLDSWGKLIYFFAVGLVLFVLPSWVSVDAQTRFGYALTFTFLLGPMEGLVAKLPVLGQASVALQNIKTLGLEAEAEPDRSLPPLATHWQTLELIGLTHTYRSSDDDREFSLGPIDLTLKPGQLVFLIGGNGSGKSTLAKLITGLYWPTGGEIRLAGQPVTLQNRRWYQQHFSTIFADFYLFERLVGLSAAQDPQPYLKQLQLDHKVRIEGGHFSTIDLSQGQRKRLALLTAYLEDRPIYLFDEWAADQDPHFRELFYTQFLPDLVAQGKTAIVISHDDHYFDLADRVIKLNYGQIEYDKTLAGHSTQL